MKHGNTITALLLLVGLTAPALLACGGDEERPRIDKSRLATTQSLEEKSDARRAAERAEGEALIEDLVFWPRGAGPARDARADYNDCQSRLEAMPDARIAHPLVQIKHMRDCMTDRGWAIDPDAGIPER